MATHALGRIAHLLMPEAEDLQLPVPPNNRLESNTAASAPIEKLLLSASLPPITPYDLNPPIQVGDGLSRGGGESTCAGNTQGLSQSPGPFRLTSGSADGRSGHANVEGLASVLPTGNISNSGNSGGGGGSSGEDADVVEGRHGMLHSSSSFNITGGNGIRQDLLSSHTQESGPLFPDRAFSVGSILARDGSRLGVSSRPLPGAASPWRLPGESCVPDASVSLAAVRIGDFRWDLLVSIWS